MMIALLNGIKAASKNITVQLIDLYASWIVIDFSNKTIITPNIAPSVIETITTADKIITIGITIIDSHQNLYSLRSTSNNSLGT